LFIFSILNNFKVKLISSTINDLAVVDESNTLIESKALVIYIYIDSIFKRKF
jgi:hypothetical protein